MREPEDLRDLVGVDQIIGVDLGNHLCLRKVTVPSDARSSLPS